ncbi:MAG TPA: Spy/CpxP family protein refolding chaperone [Minicystis sp.]|nr:Spy/CpxP family protein refolding chaperone [Minicystis sp.]
MHPAMMAWWQRRHHERHCGEHASWGHGPCGGGRAREGGSDAAWAAPADHDDLGGGPFGVRRPLRFLAHKLDLDDKQVAELARVLNELKTERAQAAVDNRRAVAGFADAVAGDTFDEAKTNEMAADRVKSAERLRDALVKALGRIHAVLDAEQRQKLAYLIRTGALQL